MGYLLRRVKDLHYKGGHMEWFAAFIDKHGASLVLPIVLIVVVFILLAIRAHQKHLATLEKVKRDIDIK